MMNRTSSVTSCIDVVVASIAEQLEHLAVRLSGGAR